MRRKIRLFGLLVVLLVVAVPVGGAWVARYLHQPLPLKEAQLVLISPGTGFNRFLYDLRSEGLLGDAHQAHMRYWGARLYSAFTGIAGRMHVGEYRVEPGDSLLTLLDRIDQGKVLQRSITFVDGWNFREMRARLAGMDTIEHRIKGLSDAQVMTRLGRQGQHPEGWFAPDTYFYTRGTTDLTLLQRALERQQAILDRAWAQRDQDLPYDTPYKALIMASIVEKETGVPDERAEIAGVFVNRLRKGMRLQTDPTVIYGMGERYDGNIRRSDLRRPTPYNTYVIQGLPPTPIAMPGREAIEAAMHPAHTEALYFVARGDGSHYFSKTLAEHRKAVRDYQLRRRDGYRSAPGDKP
ncbi:hypothetical protein A11A3_04455 [Alcanivorax hongdengensis A-11-3]|uniref:Endolytic murein transglycosylase n=1 Tax=Alcanivorax hongdengensis A-11-3 TaxID=1177179 RepID=L0WDS8_9GAMM|nr:endolytic transglycosylase MltG [Alcanivorax hongdengensis]EKF75201.1 hypothetical protein A11A3_04455 [Alcanivorax hongdengensis A-11-3]